MLFRTIVSAFFLEPSSDDDLATLAARGGMTNVTAFDELTREALGFHEPGRQVLGGVWKAFQETWAIVDDLGHTRCLQFYSPATRYLDAARAAWELGNADEGSLLPYVRTFHDACLSLDPRAAFLDTKPHYEDEAWENKQGSRAFVIEQADLVAAWDANALAGQHFSLLYLNTGTLARWTHALSLDDREMMELPTGRLIFAGSGPTRMA